MTAQSYSRLAALLFALIALLQFIRAVSGWQIVVNGTVSVPVWAIACVIATGLAWIGSAHHADSTSASYRMPNWETFLLLLPSVVFSLAAVALVLWPVFVAMLEISKAIRSPVTQSSRFIISNSGATIWSTSSRRAKGTSLSVGDERLRLSVLLACAMEAAFIVFLTVFLFQHADPRGDGMKMVGVGFAFMLIFLPLTLPAFILARHGRWLVLAAGLAALAAAA